MICITISVWPFGVANDSVLQRNLDCREEEKVWTGRDDADNLNLSKLKKNVSAVDKTYFCHTLTHMRTAIQSVNFFPIRGLRGFIMAMYLCVKILTEINCNFMSSILSID